MTRKIIFSHKRALGDGLMFTSGIRDFKLLFPDILINVDSNQKALWENNPYISKELVKGQEDVEYYKIGYPMVGNVNNTNMHFTSMFLFDMIAMADLHEKLPMELGEFCSVFANGQVGDPSISDFKKHSSIAKEPFISLRKKYSNICNKFSRQRGDIHFSEKEKSDNLIRDLYGIEKYWVITPGGKRDCTAKVWDWRKFQDVINYFDGKIKFVVVGKSDLLVEKLDNVINLVDKFNSDVRPLFSVVYHSEGCVSGPSFLMHLAASIPPKQGKARKPCVSIFGGREPSSWSWYCNQQVLHTNGAYTCCDNGGCWKARTYPLPKDDKHNKNLCSHTVKIEGRTVQECMDNITSQDVIRAIEKYYQGNIYNYSNPKKKILDVMPNEVKSVPDVKKTTIKEINMLGNLNSKGGGEQSLCMLAKLFTKRGWKVNLYPWSSVNDKYKNLGIDIQDVNFKNGDMVNRMKKGVPLLFYANDCIWDFVKQAQDIVANSSFIIIGINFCNGSLPNKAGWLAKTKKVKAVIFQNEEKKSEFIRDAIGFEETRLISLYGAIDLDKFLEACPPKKREKKEELVILKHCMPDYRKYVTEQSKNGGEKIHIWQKHIFKEVDTKFYKRLLKDTDNTRFEFMEAHKELVNAFKDDPRMIFHKLDTMPVDKFLKRGHLFLYRTSNSWRDNYPRVLAEALAVGIPALVEPRDGNKDRVIHGDTGFYCVDYDGFLYSIKLLQRKEDYRHHMARNAKDWARENLRPEVWVDIIEELL